MDTASVLPVVSFLHGSIRLLPIGFLANEGDYHLRCCSWVRNKISVRIEKDFAFGYLGFSFQIQLEIRPSAMLLSAYRVPCGHGKCNIFIRRSQCFLSIYCETSIVYQSRASPCKILYYISVCRRRTLLSYITGIFDKVSVYDGLIWINRRFRSEKILSLAVMKSKLFTISTRVPALHPCFIALLC